MAEQINFPKITVITPSYNQGQFLEETIRSVLSQNYPNLEYMIIDGGSNDNSVAIIQKYADQLSFWVSEKDSGQSAAINKGLARASGDIITWLNSDDYYFPNTLNLVAGIFLQEKNTGIVHGKTLLFGEDIRSRPVGPVQDLQPWEYLSSMKVPQPSAFFSKKTLDAVGPLNESLHYAMDFELVAKSVLLEFPLKRLDAILSGYRLHKNSKSMDELKFLPDWTYVVYTLFSSVPGAGKWAETLKELGLVNQAAGTPYKVTQTFTAEERELIFLHHLLLHYHYHYRFFNVASCEKISTYLLKQHPHFYKEQALNKYNLRLKIIPKFIFTFIRKLRH